MGNSVGEKEKRIDLLDILLDQDNKEPIVLGDENGKSMTFEQVAVIPYDVDGHRELYAILKPMDKISGISEDEAIVFLIDTDDEGWSILKMEMDEKIAVAVFDKYYDLLDNSGDEEAKKTVDELRKKTHNRK